MMIRVYKEKPENIYHNLNTFIKGRSKSKRDRNLKVRERKDLRSCWKIYMQLMDFLQSADQSSCGGLCSLDELHFRLTDSTVPTETNWLVGRNKSEDEELKVKKKEKWTKPWQRQ